jgi:hypothetical protein
VKKIELTVESFAFKTIDSITSFDTNQTKNLTLNLNDDIDLSNYEFSNNIKHLKFNNVKLDGLDLPESLRTLSFINTTMDDADLQALNLPSSLKKIIIRNSKITKEGIDYLQTIDSLQYSVQKGEFIKKATSEGVLKEKPIRSFREILNRQSTLQSGYCCDTREGKTILVEIEPGITVPPEIDQYLVSFTVVSETIDGLDLNNVEHVSLRGPNVRNITNLNLRNVKNFYLSDMDLADFNFNGLGLIDSQVERFSADGSGLDDEDFKTIVNGNNKLEGVILSSNNITSFNGVSLSNNLDSLHLDDNKITNTGSLELPGSLVDVDLSDNEITSIEDLELPNRLQYLTLSHNKLRNLEGMRLPDSLLGLELDDNEIESLEGIDFSNLGNESDDFSSSFGSSFSINLSFNNLSSEEVNKLPPNLSTLLLEGNNIGPTLDLSRFTNVRFIYLSNNPLEELTGLEGLENLRIIELNNTNITSKSQLKLPNEDVSVDLDPVGYFEW